MNSTAGDPDSDADVVRRSLAHPEAFAELFDRHAHTLHRYAERRAGRAVAEDVMSETFLIAFERRHSFDLSVESARPWLYGIASHLLSRRARAEDRRWRAYARAHHVERAETLEETSAGRVDAASAIQSLASVVVAMSPVDRDVLLLFAWAELTYAEIADALGLPLGTVRSKLHRARAALRGELASAQTVNEQEPCHD